MAIFLVSMDTEEAIVAEQVNTYKRTEVESQLVTLKTQVEEDKLVISELESKIAVAQTELETVRAQVKERAYKLELYEALKEAFDRDFPPAKTSSCVTTGKAPEDYNLVSII